MKFSLETKIIKPENNSIKSAVILLHGYGGDGNDISAVTLIEKGFTKTIFLNPMPTKYVQLIQMVFNGLVWIKKIQIIFLKNQLKQKKLNFFINEIKSEYNLNNSEICISVLVGV